MFWGRVMCPSSNLGSPSGLFNYPRKLEFFTNTAVTMSDLTLLYPCFIYHYPHHKIQQFSLSVLLRWRKVYSDTNHNAGNTIRWNVIPIYQTACHKTLYLEHVCCVLHFKTYVTTYINHFLWYDWIFLYLILQAVPYTAKWIGWGNNKVWEPS